MARDGNLLATALQKGALQKGLAEQASQARQAWTDYTGVLGHNGLWVSTINNTTTAAPAVSYTANTLR